MKGKGPEWKLFLTTSTVVIIWIAAAGVQLEAGYLVPADSRLISG
ncbi:hypothetical protein [Terribacillus aidingensis]|nr:hypothetical protein [Terribacillus aidingensis]